MAYELTNGPVPSGLVLRHKCDNMLCCNPAHLETGAHADNVADRVARGRSAGPEISGTSKLSRDQVREILAYPKTHGSGVVLAKLYGVTSGCISAIRTGRHWKGEHSVWHDQL